jgi:hypothetical protein
MADAYYAVRFLEPKQTGRGVIAFAFSVDRETDISEVREWWPDQFVAPGFYTLMKATGDTLTIEDTK